MFQILLQGAHVEYCDSCNLYVRPHSSTAHNPQIRHHTVDYQFIPHCRLGYLQGQQLAALPFVPARYER